MTRLSEIVDKNVTKYAGAMEALAKGVEVSDELKNCIHEWDYTDGPSGLFNCQKCGELIDSTDAMNHLNMLEADLANTRAVWNECEAKLAARDALIERFVYVGNMADLWILPDGQRRWNALVAEHRATKGGVE